MSFYNHKEIEPKWQKHWADHIGIVEKVENGIIHTIEGNSNNEVKRNTYRIGHGNIRGFASPRYR